MRAHRTRGGAVYRQRRLYGSLVCAAWKKFSLQDEHTTTTPSKGEDRQAALATDLRCQRAKAVYRRRRRPADTTEGAPAIGLDETL
ncbi:hypothetical protein HPB52_000619 [Rhipicephalus sanguineus]|uniref:Uncharacterized protein n=1 Tax=Rhipicephalus sanguineus TaxID=34632 RepID=A0A9D4T6L0_RHISA|nr:hypothetical protein HPB52_000619 [Rhipicephalus sanguineus]